MPDATIRSPNELFQASSVAKRRGLRYRLGIDLGSDSIGWAMLRLDGEDQPCAVIRTGVRIFSDGRDPQSGTSLAVERRKARQMRRRRDRFLKRRARLIQALVDLGFWPRDEAERRKLAQLNPYVLRAEGLDRRLPPAEFGRAIYHLNQRRGFKSNRQTDRDEKERDQGLIASSVSRTREWMASEGARTVGEWLYRRLCCGQRIRARLRGETSRDRGYELYFDRTMIEEEFDALWAAQQRFDPDFYNDARRASLRDIIFFQRPLKPVMPGRCTFLPEEPRCPWALPSAQRFRIFQELNHLRWFAPPDFAEQRLSRQQRDELARELEQRDLSFTRIRRLLRLPADAHINFEDGKRDKLQGSLTSQRLGKPDLFGARWHDFTLSEQDAIVERLLSEPDEVRLIHWLTSTYQCCDAHARAIAAAPLPEGYAMLSKKAIDRILPQLIDEVIPYSEAVTRAGFPSHSALGYTERTGEILERLPYYGEILTRHVAFGTGSHSDPPEKRFGRIANPTVHIALNELRKVVNALIQRYGPPAEVVVEVTRELKQSRRRRSEEKIRQAQRQKENEHYREQIASVLGKTPDQVTAPELEKMRLWVELNPSDPNDRRCPYTGEPIGIKRLLSAEVEIDHILPFSRTLDDSLANKTVCLRQANRDKGSRTPFEAFGASPGAYQWASILARAKTMGPNKFRRFLEDGYEWWLREEADFLARQLNDTAYASRLAREYLSAICPPNRVWVIPGRLTALLRAKFGLNDLLGKPGEKNRDDHRHHAVDACVIAINDRSLLQRVSAASAQAESEGVERLLARLDPPWPSFREQVERAVLAVNVSYRPDHGFEGRMHNDTAYGLRPDGRVVHRKPLADFKSPDDILKTEFADPALKERLLAETQGLDGKDFKQRLIELAERLRIRRVRIVEDIKVIPFTEPTQSARHGVDDRGLPRPYKGYKGDSNYCLEIFLDDRGKWGGELISTFAAYQIARQHGGGASGLEALRNPRHAHNGRTLVMRLVRGDYVVLEVDGTRRLMRVAQIVASGSEPMVKLHEHFEANVDARVRRGEFGYLSRRVSGLMRSQARYATVSPIGELRIHPLRCPAASSS